MTEKSQVTTVDLWQKMDVRRCDLCNKIARWRHPAGGYRCSKCPRPSLGLRAMTKAKVSR